jgi:hypothetical protein
MAVNAVRKGDGESRRVWCCDGRYVAWRPSEAHDATKERHARFLAAGHYKHVETQDDVEIFELLPESPFYRREGLDLYRAGTWECIRQCALAACARDWPLYTDILEEIATRCRSVGHAGYAEQVFSDHIKMIGLQVQMRGGPTPQECAAGKDNVMRKRGNRQLIIPARRV